MKALKCVVFTLSCVPVVNQDGECFGVISAPDLIHFHQARKNPLAEKAWEMCTHQMIEVDTELSIEDAAQLMIDNNIHHLIVSDGQAIKGIVSSLDILRGYLPTESG